MQLHPELLRAIYAYGFKRPSAIQQRAIVPIIKGLDVVAHAHAGTGKTAAIAISILHKLDLTINATQAVVLAPTRELAYQIHQLVVALGDYLGASSIACVGGTNIRDLAAKLTEGPQVVVGTPGRVFDMIKRGALRTDSTRIVCLDEADQVPFDGFIDQIRDLFQLFPPGIQVALFSPTMPIEVLELSEKFMRDPVRCEVPHGSFA